MTEQTHERPKPRREGTGDRPTRPRESPREGTRGSGEGRRERPREDREDREDHRDRERRDEQTDSRREKAEEPSERRGGLSPTRLAQCAVGHLQQLTTREIEAVVGMSRAEDGNLKVVLEVVENHHFPDSADVMAEYTVEVDPEGELVGYSRGQRYLRGRPAS